MSVLRRVLPLVCCALLLLLAASALGQTKTKTTTTQQSAPCGLDGDGNPIPPANCVAPAPSQTPATPQSLVSQTPATPQPPAPQTPTTPQPATQPTNVCKPTGVADGASIDIPPAIIGGGDATFSLANPMYGKNAKEVKVSWIFEQPNATAPASLQDGKPFPFRLGSCGPDPGDPTKPLTRYFPPASDFNDLAKAEAIVIGFTPSDTGKLTRTLQLAWNEGTTPTTKKYIVTGDGGAPDYAKDSRYKVWAYTGFTFLRSQNDFSDSFAELLIRVETRWIDARIAMMQHQKALYDKVMNSGVRCANDQPTTATFTGNTEDVCKSASFFIVRLYGEAGLTGTTASATTASTIGGAQESFTGGFGLGIGGTRLVSHIRPEDTSAFSWLIVPRLGLTSIPAQTGHPETAFTAYDYSANVRIENEPSLDDKMKAGNFEGAYFEFGFGESERFSRKKFPRLRADGYLPIPGGSDLFRFAMRLQIDAPRPFAKLKTNPGDNLGNEIRISALFNLNLLELGKRMSGAK